MHTHTVKIPTGSDRFQPVPVEQVARAAVCSVVLGPPLADMLCPTSSSTVFSTAMHAATGRAAMRRAAVSEVARKSPRCHYWAVRVNM
ncbi:hypothetical protein V7S43_001692 [Phytophthora oleae]|uniref:Uncharacterized protein n=1 Tax=Phytophthora oleae TaxID=2107226 RepID=A0ABD3G4E4_9STRA